MRKNQYDNLEKQLQEVSLSVAKDTGYTPETAEAVLKLMTAVASQQADITAQQKNIARRDAKILATRELLKNYHKIKASVKSAVVSTEQVLEENEFQRLMEQENSMRDQQIRSVAVATARSKALLAQIDSALESFKEICSHDSNPRCHREYPILYLYYIHKLPVDNICERLNISRMTFFRGLEDAIKEFSIILPLEATVEDFASSKNGKASKKQRSPSTVPDTTSFCQPSK